MGREEKVSTDGDRNRVEGRQGITAMPGSEGKGKTGLTRRPVQLVW